MRLREFAEYRELEQEFKKDKQHGGQCQRIVPSGQPDHHAMRQAADLDFLVRRIRGQNLTRDPARARGVLSRAGASPLTIPPPARPVLYAFSTVR